MSPNFNKYNNVSLYTKKSESGVGLDLAYGPSPQVRVYIKINK